MTNPSDPATKNSRLGFAAMILGVLMLVGATYWPLRQAWFVWDDKIMIHDTAWLSVGNRWVSIVFHGLPDWEYFRPLGLALLVAETRLFGAVPGPMHLISIAFHLIDTLLVGALALKLLARKNAPTTRSRVLTCVAMLLYGLHPAAIEPVSWIASQFDLLLTFLVLAGLLLNLGVARPTLRGGLVATSFFLAACTKEAAIVFPLLLFLLDWSETTDEPHSPGAIGRIRQILSRQWQVYLCTFIAGLIYLVLRHWGKPAGTTQLESFFTLDRLQAVCYTYMTYWRVILWPYVGMAPQHLLPNGYFGQPTLPLLLMVVAAFAVVAMGLFLTWRRRPAGLLILGVTAALFPVLHIIPVGFEDSLYHDRYALLAIAWTCAFLPAVVESLIARLDRRQTVAALKMSGMVAAIWLLFAGFTVRTTIPLWFNDVRLWTWALQSNPDSLFVLNNLLDSYIQQHDDRQAAKLVDTMLIKGKKCVDCMLTVANFGLVHGDVRLGEQALKAANEAFKDSAPTHSRVIGYVLSNANLHMIKKDFAGAEAAFRDAISLDPSRPGGYFGLANALALQGRSSAAQAAFAQAARLSSADQAAGNRPQFESALKVGKQTHPSPTAPPAEATSH